MMLWWRECLPMTMLLSSWRRCLLNPRFSLSDMYQPRRLLTIPFPRQSPAQSYQPRRLKFTGLFVTLELPN